MNLEPLRFAAKVMLFALVSTIAGNSLAQLADISSSVQIASEGKHVAQDSLAGVVVWLSPVLSISSPPLTVETRPGRFQLTQKDKSFSPHLLVVPLGSTIDFPNKDPFFHNVFSLFNGKRFDLGLYESGSTRAVRFDHEGVSYIFCNIHPEMSAVVVVLSTPFFAVSTATGALSFAGVPSGEYEVHVWAEGANTKQLAELGRHLHVTNGHIDLGTIRLTRQGQMAGHKNKFGEDYKLSAPPIY